MDFAQNWDTSMIEMWHMAKNEYAVLSTYVTNVDQVRYLVFDHVYIEIIILDLKQQPNLIQSCAKLLDG